MNLREGKIGFQEALYTCALALCMSGLFSFDSANLYSGGNSAYVSVPLGALLAGLTFLLCYSAIKKSNSRDYLDMLEYGAGRVGSKVLAAILFIALVLGACLPLNRFMNLMHSDFYSETEYYSIAVFIIPTLIIPAWLGLETIGRVAKILGVVFFVTHVLTLINSTTTFESYRVSPVLGMGLEGTLSQGIRTSFVFLPALLALLCVTRGVHGVGSAGKIGLVGIGIAIIVCAITQLALAYVFTYKDLASIYGPLYKLSLLTSESDFIIRLDKIMVFIWLSGVMLSSAFYAYSASIVFARGFGQRDIRPAVLGVGVIILAIALASHTGAHFAEALFDFVRYYGFLVLFVPNIIVAGIALVRKP